MPQAAHLQIATPGGVPVRVRSGSNDDFWAAYQNGDWEPDTAAVFRRFLDADHSYIDIGAWIGPTLLLGCQLAGRAFGIEPDPLAYDELLENIERNRPLTDNVTLSNVCIAPASGKVSFGSRRSGGDSMSSLLFAGGKTSWTVDGVGFQEWIAANNITDCNFIKIDIEGAEYSVLPTMAAYLRANRPTLHLSLHPCFLGDLHARGAMAKLKRSWLRLASTMRLIRLLDFYAYLYFPPRERAVYTLRQRLVNFLARWNRRPVVSLMACWYAIRGGTNALVFTDRRW